MIRPVQISRSVGFKSLLSIKECMLLFIELDFLSEEERKGGGYKERAHHVLWQAPLVAWAADHDVPILNVCRPEAPRTRQRSLSAFGDMIFCDQLNPLDNPELRDRLAALRRPRLLLAGGALEIALAFSALSALELGYDVYLVHDLSWSVSETHADIVIARLLQAGVVPIIASQLLCEWQRDETQSS